MLKPAGTSFEKGRWKQTPILLLYMAMGIPMFFFYKADILVGGFGIMYYYIFGIMIILLGFFRFLYVPDVDRFLLVMRYSFIMALPYLFSLLYSAVIWVIRLEEFRIITRGFFYPAYQILGIMVAASTMYLFGSRGIIYMILSMLGANLLQLMQIASIYGAGEVIREYLKLLTSFAAETGPAMRQMEHTGTSFALGLFLVYFIIAGKECRRYLWLVIPCTVFFLAGMKRITIPGILVAIAAGLFLKKLTIDNKRSLWIYAGTVTLVVMGLLYVWLIRNGTFAGVMKALGIDTKGRVEFYKVIDAFYEFTPLYFGKGLGYISRMIQSGRIDLGYDQAGELHNDFLRQYIEIGFFGYIVWLWMMFVTRVRYFVMTRSSNHGILVFCCVIYCFFNYLTDNTYYYYYTNVALAAVVMCYCMEDGERNLKIR